MGTHQVAIAVDRFEKLRVERLERAKEFVMSAGSLEGLLADMANLQMLIAISQSSKAPQGAVFRSTMEST